MRYKTDQAFRQALEQRLTDEARTGKTSLVRLRRLVTFDRFLARFRVVAPDRWLLKGGVALDYRLPIEFRTTRDLDISRQDDENAASEDFADVQALDLQDYFSFSMEKAEQTDVEQDNTTVRYHMTALLADRPFERVNVDVSFDDPVFAIPAPLESRALLEFADIDPITVQAIPLEQHIAEKLHAYSRIYADQRRSSRAKDLIDLVVIQEYLPVHAGRLMGALRLTFAARNSHELPSELPLPPESWRPTYARIAAELNLNPDPRSGHQVFARLLEPVLKQLTNGEAMWNPRKKQWE